MPGHSAVWKHYGASYEQLAKQPNTVLKPFPLVQDAKLLDTAAGKPSTLPARGCGSFVQQVGRLSPTSARRCGRAGRREHSD